ncbi:MAG TPA: hypothetical protein VF458_00095 [Ktedonobacteraceae bacterium]
MDHKSEHVHSVAQSLARLATIIGPLLGDGRYQDADLNSAE